MYSTTPDDLTRIANDLGQIARRYMQGSQELDQHITSLDHTASHLLYGGAKPWVGVASEAFQGSWAERRARMQQASQLLTQSAHYLTRFAQTIEEYLPQIRLDQQLMQGPTSHLLAPDDQASILNGESQAQNAILMAMQALNYQLEVLADEVRDCPEEEQNDPLGNGWFNNGIAAYDGAEEPPAEPEPGEFDSQTTPLDLEDKDGFFPFKNITDVGKKLLKQLIDEGVTIRWGDYYEARMKQPGVNAKGSTVIWNLPGDTDIGPHNIDIILSQDATDATVYEEYLHFEKARERGWLGNDPIEGDLEEINVETQVLNDNEKMHLNMTDEEKRILENNIKEYRRRLGQAGG